ncbi:hypothetical protein N7G274_008126 [Stereocaulon virgatum]|uniref:S-adenosyl-L-methionine-dependent methyltransferase n=1 Tax=Stereocaulon virgatum TaxID=373712 RepID=A0ABR4A3V9_9LECA
MPRLPSSLLRHARRQHPLLPLLLRPCRDLSSARNELRWLREKALEVAQTTSPKTKWQVTLRQSCLERSRGMPLQYILGTQPFGNLEILCRPGVLIPRPETEAITTHLASLLQPPSAPTPSLYPKRTTKNKPLASQAPLRILDLCTGTGCIPLLLHALLSPHTPSLHISGIDISPRSTTLAHKNLTHNIKTGSLPQPAKKQLSFHQADIFSNNDSAQWAGHSTWDVLVSNPPYISPCAFNTTTSRSVRTYEPKTALVPHVNNNTAPPAIDHVDADTAVGDAFYPRLLCIAAQIHAKVLLMEVADFDQAVRVIGLLLATRAWEGCEIWRDEPGARKGRAEEEVVVGGGGCRFAFPSIIQKATPAEHRSSTLLQITQPRIKSKGMEANR